MKVVIIPAPCGVDGATPPKARLAGLRSTMRMWDVLTPNQDKVYPSGLSVPNVDNVGCCVITTIDNK